MTLRERIKAPIVLSLPEKWGKDESMAINFPS